MDPTTGILSYVVNKIGDLILSEVDLLTNTREDLEWLKKELGMMQATLNDLATRDSQEDRINAWKAELRQVASHAKDVVDNFSPHVGSDTPKFKYCLSCCNFRIKSRHVFGMEVAQLKKSVAELARFKTTYVDIIIPDTRMVVNVDQTDINPSDGILSNLVDNLGGDTVNEAPLRSDTQEDLAWLQRELEMMQAVLNDVATMDIQNARTETWIEKTRELAFNVEDVMDTFSLRVGNTANFGMEVAQLRNRSAHLERMQKIYDIQTPDKMSTVTVDRRDELLQFRKLKASPYVEDEDVVGLDKHVAAVIELLDREGSRRSVVAIVGMGGLGKTTLAKKLYNNLKSNFDCTAWVVVSYEYKIIDIFKKLATDMMGLSSEAVGKMNQDAVTQQLSQFLASRKYLIVVDDVWKSQVWESLRSILQNSDKGSRVIITTRNVEVGKLANPNMYMLQALNEEDSRILFTKKAFPNEKDGEQCYTEELASLREKILKMCEGLPLAIIVVGSLLSLRDKSPAEWGKVAEKIEWKQTENGEQSARILRLSYMDLPVYLRQCFLYLAAIPEDSELRAKRLMRLWIAEGFIKQEAGKSLEETAERYLEELVNRCLIQVVERAPPNGSVEICRVHDLILDLAVSEANNTRFLDVRRTATDRRPGTLLRRLSLTTACSECTTLFPLESNGLRTLLIMDPIHWKRKEGTYIVDEKIVGNIEWSSNLKLLRVLELSVSSHRLPDEIGNLVNLRYLSFSSSFTMNLPGSLENLRHLQTLDIGMIDAILPVSIWRIKTLRYLCGGWETEMPAPEASLPIDGSWNLRTLRHVLVQPWMEEILPKLSNLRELELCRDQDGSIPDYLWGTIRRLQRLKVLAFVKNIFFKGNKPVLDIAEIFSPSNSHPCLHTLDLSHFKVNSSNIQALPPNLEQVKLFDTRINHGLIELLGKLRFLRLLRLSLVSISEGEMIFQSGWFRQLNVLVLKIVNIKTWELVEESPPPLRELKISRCPRLQTLPESLRLLRELKIVYR